jgi:hypothetical protein
LAAFIVKKRAERRRRTSPSVLARDDDDDSHYIFGAWQGLTPEQTALAEKLWRRAYQMRGPVTGFRRALRIGGIISAVKRGLAGNSAWGRKMLAHRGGRVMALHGPHILQAIARAGARASVIARDRCRARHSFRPGV